MSDGCSGRRGLADGVGCLGGELVLIPGERASFEVSNDVAEPADFCVEHGLLVLGLKKGDPGEVGGIVVKLVEVGPPGF